MIVVLKNVLLAIIGLAGGIAVAGGVFAFISILGIIPRMSARLRVASRSYGMETSVFLGGTIGSVVNLYKIHLPFGSVGLAVFGLFVGIFIGCLAMALAETLKVIPVLAHRTRLQWGMPLLMIAIGVGKACGSFYQLFVVWSKN